MALKLYGVPLSQPFRSVAWALLQKKVPFQVALTVPAMKTKMGAQHPSFLEKAPLGSVPVIEELDSGYVLWESPAILAYLAESRGWDDLYPTAPEAKGRVNAYMHWHHTNTRTLANTVKPFLRPDLGVATDAQLADCRQSAASTLEVFGKVWLAQGHFIAGAPSATVADLLAYGEVSQLLPEYCNSMPGTPIDTSVLDWCKRMQGLPHHDAVNACLSELGDVTAPNDLDMPKRLGQATKVGLKAIAAAASEA